MMDHGGARHDCLSQLIEQRKPHGLHRGHHRPAGFLLSEILQVRPSIFLTRGIKMLLYHRYTNDYNGEMKTGNSLSFLVRSLIGDFSSVIINKIKF